MNRTQIFFDEQEIRSLLHRRLPEIKTILEIKIVPYKKYLWGEDYHLVLGYETNLILTTGEKVFWSIFCIAHSHEPRECAFDALQLLWEKGMDDDRFALPKPLFFTAHLNAVFYIGIQGHSLFHYIKIGEKDVIKKMVQEIAVWFSKLHAITYTGGNLFNVINSRLVTVLPGSRHQIHRVQEAFPQYLELYQKAYDIFLKTEYEFLSSTTKRYLIHGDAHPDNIMLTNGGRLGVIDFSDLSYADFARDLGCFLEQTEYMCSKRNFTKEEIEEIKQLFMDTYLGETKIEMTPDLQKRIDNYYYWTKIRTMSYILFSGAMERDAETLARAEVLAKELKLGLGI